jgi:hypothetical protein
MITRELTLQILGKTETELDNIMLGLEALFNGSNHVKLVSVDTNTKFNWDAETVISEKKEESLEPYYEIADRLYTKLLQDNKSFTDWEYKFISNNYDVAEAKGFYSIKVREWLKKLEEKYL